MERYNEGIIGVSIIWAAVLIASAIILQGTNYFSQLIPILGGGTASCIIILGSLKDRKNVENN